MKIVYASDLHLEFANLPHGYELPDGDLFVLAGDICDTSRLELEKSGHFPETDCRLYSLLSAAYEKYGVENVIYVAGNHEHYGTKRFQVSARNINELLREHSRGAYDSSHNFIQEENAKIYKRNGLTILAGTMWTSYNSGDYNQMRKGEVFMNDYRLIQKSDYVDTSGYEYFTGIRAHEDVYPLNQKFIATLKEVKPDIVITHHTPSRKCNDEGHGTGNEHLYFCTDAEKFLERYENETKLWICGHTHDPVDFVHNGTRIVNNPRGYKGYETIADRFDFKVVEV